jgi:ABC-2 type transport system ATP-binding protein
MQIDLQQPVDAIPASLVAYDLSLGEGGQSLLYTYDTRAARTGITSLLGDISKAGLLLQDVQTSQSSLEDIFVDLVGK